MNKTKRAIIQLRTNLVRKMTTQIQPFKADSKWIQKWYTENAKTPLQVAGEVYQLKSSKLHAIFHKVHDYNGLTNTWGNLFDVKFPMVAYICKHLLVSAYRSYNDFLDKFNPEYTTVSSFSYVYQKRCRICENVYYKKNITKEQFDNFSGNDNIVVKLEHDNSTWSGEIESVCGGCVGEIQEARY